MTFTQVTYLTSKVFLVLGLMFFLFSIIQILICYHKKKDYSSYIFLAQFSAIIVILAKFNLFYPLWI